jgi:ubiquinone/menaquinone biosynthesis C-methylase UbiE
MFSHWLARGAVVNFYDRWVLPSILDWAMRQNQLKKYRREVAASASGRVLEVGVGSGLNFPLYGKQVEIVFGIDLSPRLLGIARRRAAAGDVRAEFLQGSATAIPLADNTVDTVVMTWTLCSIADPQAALREMRRVLKLFVERSDRPSAAPDGGDAEATRVNYACNGYPRGAGRDLGKTDSWSAPAHFRSLPS